MSDQKKSSPPHPEQDSAQTHPHEITMTNDERIHEIQSCVDIILGFASVLKEHGLSVKDQHKFIEIIERNARRITSLSLVK